MSKKRPSFKPEFKLEAVSLVTDKRYSLSEACQALGGWADCDAALGKVAQPRTRRHYANW
jgi:hypothetical protein